MFAYTACPLVNCKFALKFFGSNQLFVQSLQGKVLYDLRDNSTQSSPNDSRQHVEAIICFYDDVFAVCPYVRFSQLCDFSLHSLTGLQFPLLFEIGASTNLPEMLIRLYKNSYSTKASFPGDRSAKFSVASFFEKTKTAVSQGLTKQKKQLVFLKNSEGYFLTCDPPNI